MVFSASRDGVGVLVEGAKEALAIVAEMESFHNLVAEIAVAVFSVEILKGHNVVLKIICGGNVGSHQAAQRAFDRGSIFGTLKSLFCTTLADRVQASLQHLRNM